MSQKGDGVSQSGFISECIEDMTPCSGKRSRDESEGGRDSTALGADAKYVKMMDLNLSSNIVSCDRGRIAGEDQTSFLKDPALSHLEKRMKCGPSALESDSQTPIPSSLTAEINVMASNGGNNVGTEIPSLSEDCAAAVATVSDKAAEVHMASDGGNNISTEMPSQNLSQDHIATVATVSDKAAEGYIASDGLNNVSTETPSQNSSQDCAAAIAAVSDMVRIKMHPQFHCDICSVKCTSAKDLGTHRAGKRHTKKARELGIGTSCNANNSPLDGSEAIAYTYPGLTHPHTASVGQQGLVDIPGGTNEEFQQPCLFKCPYSSDPNAITLGQQASILCPHSEVFVNECLKNYPPSKLHCNDGHNRYFYQPGTNGSFHNPTLADGLLEERIGTKGKPLKNLIASLSTKSKSDCVARALASALSMYGCPGVGDPQKGGSCVQAVGCSGSQVKGAINAESDGMVTMHTRCFSNLLHELQVCIMKDMVMYGGLKAHSRLPRAMPVPSAAPQGEDLHCTLCRVEYGSRADLDLHLAGKKHASLAQRVYSKCQLCNLNCNTEKDFKIHLSGKRHASKLRLVQKRVTF